MCCSRVRSRAATRQVTRASEAEPWMTPPPGPWLRNVAGRWKSWHIQSRTMVSSSVMAGEHCQLNAGAVKAAE